MNKTRNAIIALTILVAARLALAADTYVLADTCAGKELSGREAVKMLIEQPDAKIIKYSLIELSEKTGKIKNKSNR